MAKRTKSTPHETDEVLIENNSNNGLDTYPIDSLLIRSEPRTIVDMLRRIKKGVVILDPEFQRDFVWDTSRQSRLVESVLMRIPLPVFYFAESKDGNLIVVDGLQRLSTLKNFYDNKLKLELANKKEINKKTYKELPSNLQDRFEDGQIIAYLIDSKVPDRVRLDIFDRVNSGVPLTRQQMRNALYTGKATNFLKTAASSKEFAKATGNALSTKKNIDSMRDREVVNRFLAFTIQEWTTYVNDADSTYDDFLGSALDKFNKADQAVQSEIENQFIRSMKLNYLIFEKHSFRKSLTESTDVRKPLNVAIFDVLSVLIPKWTDKTIKKNLIQIRKEIKSLFSSEKFANTVTSGTTDTERVRSRFDLTYKTLKKVLNDPDR